MALLLRLFPRGKLGLQRIRTFSVTPCCRKVTLAPSTYVPPESLDYDEKNSKMKRPLSPHLTIYKIQMTSLLSITHRFTGIILSGYLSAIGLGSFLIDKPMVNFISDMGANYPCLFLMLKIPLLFSFAYHYFNGIRHLAWDNGKFLTIPEVYRTGIFVVIGGIVLGTALAFFPSN